MGKHTYVAVGNKEDISDLITNISPKETPFYSASGKVAVWNSVPQVSFCKTPNFFAPPKSGDASGCSL